MCCCDLRIDVTSLGQGCCCCSLCLPPVLLPGLWLQHLLLALFPFSLEPWSGCLLLFALLFTLYACIKLLISEYSVKIMQHGYVHSILKTPLWFSLCNNVDYILVFVYQGCFQCSQVLFFLPSPQPWQWCLSKSVQGVCVKGFVGVEPRISSGIMQTQLSAAAVNISPNVAWKGPWLTLIFSCGFPSLEVNISEPRLGLLGSACVTDISKLHPRKRCFICVFSPDSGSGCACAYIKCGRSNC